MEIGSGKNKYCVPRIPPDECGAKVPAEAPRRLGQHVAAAVEQLGWELVVARDLHFVNWMFLPVVLELR
jgi:hypothetical protein